MRATLLAAAATATAAAARPPPPPPPVMAGLDPAIHGPASDRLGEDARVKPGQDEGGTGHGKGDLGRDGGRTTPGRPLRGVPAIPEGAR
jgi:hypothetical protein